MLSSRAAALRGLATLSLWTLAAQAELPQMPSRTDVLQAMRSVSGAVRDCAPDFAGQVVVVRVTFGPSGAVLSAAVQGNFAGTQEQQRCIGTAVRRASVAPFRGPAFSVSFPFRVQP